MTAPGAIETVQGDITVSIALAAARWHLADAGVCRRIVLILFSAADRSVYRGLPGRLPAGRRRIAAGWRCA